MRVELPLLWGLSLIAVFSPTTSTTEMCKNIAMSYDQSRKVSKDPVEFTTITDMSLHRNYPGSWPCNFGQTFGYEGQHIWTSHYCKAIFRVCGKKPGSTLSCQRMRLQSINEKYLSVEVDKVVVSMHAVRKWSRVPCTLSETYGFSNKKKLVWVDKGCRGDFDVCSTLPKEKLKCRTVENGLDSEKGSFVKPEDLLDVRSMRLMKQLRGSRRCIKQRTYGIIGGKIWAGGRCFGKFEVCGKYDVEADKRNKEERLHKMFGQQGQTTENIMKDLNEVNKKRYKDKCKCTTWGDPHFMGFDGATIHFQGICEYTLVRTTQKNLGECAFDVSVENERRYGKQTVSFVKKVHIRMHGKEVTLGKYKNLMVDGQRKRAGYKHQDQFQVMSSGRQGLIFSSKKCGVHIAYRRNNRVEVTVSGRYSGHMEGMCGNSNGDKADDLMLADGKGPTSTSVRVRNAEIGNSWHVNRNRPDQPDECDKPQTQIEGDVEEDCNAHNVENAEEMCEPLRDEDGPFSKCLKVAGTSLLHLFEGCVTDLCAFYDNQDELDNLRCKTFETMADQCGKLGVTVPYREETNCPANCPANFDFFPFVPECQPTCTEPHPTGECLRNTAPGCLCAEGHVLEGGDCVAPSECGCQYEGKYIKQGHFIITDQCQHTRTCSYDHAKKVAVLTVGAYSCGKNAHCDREDGEQICKCNRLFKGDGKICRADAKAIAEEKRKELEERKRRLKSVCLCRPWGDPHYGVFDKYMINFMGKCTYLLSSTKTTGGKCDFAVKGKNEVRGNARVTFLREIYFEFRGLFIELRKRRKLFVNGEQRLLPYENKKKGVTIDYRGKFVDIVTDPECGLQVSFDGNDVAEIRIPRTIGKDVLGLCGKCDGLKEYVTREGVDVSKNLREGFVLIGNSWKIPNPAGVEESADCPQKEPEPECTEEEKNKAKSRTECGRLLDPRSPFAACYAQLKKDPDANSDAISLFDSCVSDACVYQDTEQWPGMRCSYNEEMAGLCAKHGIDSPWRSALFCPKNCPPHSVYKPRMSGCQPSCLNPQRPKTCLRDEVEGCECEEGFVNDQDKCVSLEECGCRDNDGDYIPIGSKYVSEDCTTLFKCVHGDDGAELQSVPQDHGECHMSATCKLGSDHKATCVCNEGFTGDGYQCDPQTPETKPPKEEAPLPKQEDDFCLCKANGDPRVIQFDNARLWVNNPCKFSLVKSDNDECKFAVEMKTVSHTKHTHMSYVYEIDIKLPELTIRLGQDLKVQTKLKPENPFEKFDVLETHQVAEHVWITSNSTGVSVHTDCGLVVLFDGKGEVTTTVPNKFAKTVTGLCGNCDGDQSNDRRDKQGRKPSHYASREEGHNAVARMHVVPDDSSEPDLSDVCSAD